MKITNLGYLLKEGIKGIFTHGFMSFAAVCVTVACLLIVGSFSILVYNVNIMVEELNQTNEILAYVDETLSDADAKSVGTKINMIDNVLRSDFIPREQALEDFIADHQDEEASFSGLDATDLRHRFRVVLEDNRQIKETDLAIQGDSRCCEDCCRIRNGARFLYHSGCAASGIFGYHRGSAGSQPPDYFQHGQAGNVRP